LREFYAELDGIFFGFGFGFDMGIPGGAGAAQQRIEG